MENKQLESENLLMNKKEELIWRVIDNVIHRERGRYGRY